MKVSVLLAVLAMSDPGLIADEAPSPSDGASQNPATPSAQKGNSNEPVLVPAGKKVNPDGQVAPITSHEATHKTATPAPKPDKSHQ